MTTIDMKEIKAKTYRAINHTDGFTEIQYGVLFLGVALLYLDMIATIRLTPFNPALILLLLPAILLVLKGKISYKRSGYAELATDKKDKTAIMTIITLLFMPLLLLFRKKTPASNKNNEPVSAPSNDNSLALPTFLCVLVAAFLPIILGLLARIIIKLSPLSPWSEILFRISPLIIGLPLCINFLLISKTAKIHAYNVAGIFTLLISIGCALSNYAENYSATFAFFLFVGSMMLITGVVMLIRFVIHNPAVQQ